MTLKDKASKINFGSLPGMDGLPSPAEAAPASGGVPATPGPLRPKTAPGLMMARASDQRSDILRENEELKSTVAGLQDAVARTAELQDELKGWEGAKASRLIDPKLIARSRWANRDPQHFLTPKFEQFKRELADAGGNVQPIKVRPIGSGREDGCTYELAFGHRRLEGCAQLGLPVLALVDNMDDRGLFVEMDRENREREDLSAWEQGVMYRRALTEGLFPSSRKLAEAVGADLTNVGRALALANLPPEVVGAFQSPLELQFRWARPLANAWDSDPDAVRSRAAKIASLNPRPKAKVVFESLLGHGNEGGGSTVLPPSGKQLLVDGKKAATMAIDGRGAVKIEIAAGLVAPAKLPELGALLERFLSKPTRKTR